MSSPTSSRSSSRGAPQAPSTPDKSRPSIARSASYSVAPKSEYLRSALHARRAQQNSTPTPSDVRSPPPPAPKFPEIKTPDSSPDVFAEFALSEEQMTPVSPIRRRRTSDAGLPRPKTNKELTQEIVKLKDDLMTTNLRVQLYKKDTERLGHELNKANQRIELLEPLEQENLELQEDNDQLRRQNEAMEDEIAHLKDDNELVQELRDEIQDLRTNNAELTDIASESTKHMDGQEIAINEAVDYIVILEEEKATLVRELSQLKERIGALEVASPASTLVDGHSRCPSRVYSVDESRPSTSHFDSDYYSQPDSPQAKPSKESFKSLVPSERSKKILDLNEERQQSARSLAQRISVASLKALSMRTPSPRSTMRNETRRRPPHATEDDRLTPTRRTLGQRRNGRRPGPQLLVEEVDYSPTRRQSAQYQESPHHAQGLRGMYRPEGFRGRRSPQGVHSIQEHDEISVNMASPSSRDGQVSVGDVSHGVPSRGSSKHAHTSSSNEHLHRRDSRHRRQSEPQVQLSLAEQVPRLPTTTSDCAVSSTSPHIPSIFCGDDLTTDLDPQEHKDRHWRDLDRLRFPEVLERQQREVEKAAHMESRAAAVQSDYQERTARSSSSKESQQTSSLESLRRHAVETQARQSRTAPNTPRVQKDFLFNHESEETFLQKTRAAFSRRR